MKKDLKKTVKKEKIKVKKFAEEFKKFISKGNVLDLAVGVIIGGAFSKIITSIVDDIIMPLIGIIIGGINFKDATITVGNAVVKYGNFLQNVIDFLIVAFCIFVFVKLINKLTNKEEKAKEPTKEEVLLTEIRDLLKKK